MTVARPLGLLLVSAAALGCGLFPTTHEYYKGQAEQPSLQQPVEKVEPDLADPPVQARRPQDAGVLPPQYADPGPGRWRALLIGISEYTRSRGYAPNLATPIRDVTRLEEVLTRGYGFSDVRTLLDGQASRRGILRALRDLHGSSTREDNVLVYYAGHGILRDDGAGAWVAADTMQEEDAIPNSDIKQRLASLPVRRVLLISDSCFSGAFLTQRGLGVVPKRIAEPSASQQQSIALVRNANASREVVSSGNLSPVPDAGLGFCQGMSPFACQLVTALEKVPPGGAVGTTDLFVDIYFHIQQQEPGVAPRQRPQRGTIAGHAGGEFYFIKRP